MRIPLFVLLLVVSLLSARADATDQSTDSLVEKIRSQLPRSWGVVYEKKASEIDVIRLHVEDESAGSAREGTDDPSRYIRTVFVFRVMPGISPADYSRMKAKNAPIQREMAQIWARIGKLGRAPEASFEPKTEQDMADMVRYKELAKLLHPLPEYYFQNITLQQIPVPETETRGLNPKELAIIESKIIKLLSPFERRKS